MNNLQCRISKNIIYLHLFLFSPAEKQEVEWGLKKFISKKQQWAGLSQLNGNSRVSKQFPRGSWKSVASWESENESMACPIPLDQYAYSGLIIFCLASLQYHSWIKGKENNFIFTFLHWCVKPKILKVSLSILFSGNLRDYINWVKLQWERERCVYIYGISTGTFTWRLKLSLGVSQFNTEDFLI
jgi:hypothetical protein